MRKAVKILVTSLVLTVIMIISITGIVMAQGPYGPQYGECPNPDCPNAGECPNPDCPNASMTLADGSGTQTQSHACKLECNQAQYANQLNAYGNTNNHQNCNVNQHMNGVD